MYQVKVSDEELGYVQTKEALKENVEEAIVENEEKNVDTIYIKVNPEYELKLVDRKIETNEQEMIMKLQQEAVVTYKYYEINVSNNKIDSVDTLEEAEELVNIIKEENDESEIDLSIIEKYTQKEDEIQTSDIDVAKVEIKEKVEKCLAEAKAQKEEEERIKSMPEINGIKIAYVPVSGTISSRYGVSSRIRKSTHTGLDIAAPSGTSIKVVASGIVTCASYSSSYGNLVKVDHGNGVETWYAHNSKIYVEVGQEVVAGEVIAAVGTTGNSTGPHLHLEIRINGEHVNPQDYLYK